MKLPIIKNAQGMSGVLIKSLDGFYFRVYDKDMYKEDGFKDFKLNHWDLEITINGEAALYDYGEENNQYLDHSPEVLGGFDD